MENTRIFEVIEGKMEQAAAHHDFYYVDGKKIPKVRDGCVYDYRDKYGLLHSTRYLDIALSTSIDGKCIKTNIHEAAEGFPKVSGAVYTIFGAGEDFVYLTKNKEPGAKFHTKTSVSGNTITVPRGKIEKREACELLRKIYMELAN